MADKNIRLRISQTGADQAARSIGKVDNRLKSLAKTATVAAAGFFGARMLIQGFRQAVDAAGRQELAERKLETALGRTSKALLDQASALQKVTTVGDEAIIEQQAFLASLEFSEAQIKDIISASLDLSAATGISLESAVRNTAKTFSGLSGELGELIPQLRDLTTEEMKAGDAVKVIADLFGGQAQENTKTMSGAIEQMKNAVSDAAEAVGAVLAPTVITAANALKGAAEFSSDFLKGLQNLKEFGDKGGLDAIKKKSDETIESYHKQGAEIRRLIGLANTLGLNGKRIAADALMDEKNNLRTRREQIVLIKQAIEEGKKQIEQDKKQRQENQEAERQQRLTNQTNKEGIDILEDMPAMTDEEMLAMLDRHSEATERNINQSIRFRESLQFQAGIKAVGLLSDAFYDLEQAGIETGQASKRFAQIQAIVDTYAAANAAYKAMAGIPVVGPALAVTASAAAIASGLANVRAIEKAATGADFVTSGPQLLMVGDNATGRERVQVTPIGTPNIDGPQGGISVNFNAPVTNDEYVRDFIIPEIKKATRMNLA